MPSPLATTATAIAAAQRADPLARVTVAAPSPYAALSLRRAVARLGTGLVNVHFTTLGHVAQSLGAPVLARTGRRPLTRVRRIEALRAIVTKTPGVFGKRAGHAATLLSLDAACRALRVCSEGDLDRLAKRGPRSRQLVECARALRAQLAPRYFDDEDVAWAAIDALDGDAGALIHYLPASVTPGQQALLNAFATLGSLHVVDRGVGEAGLPITGVIDAVDPDDEIRAVLRAVLERAQRGTPLYRMAVVWRARDPYAASMLEHARVAGIACAGPATRRLADTVAGRTLRGALELSRREFRRDDVMGWLAAAPILGANGRPVPAHRWDVVSRRAGVVRGLEQWNDRLTRRAAHLEELATRADDDLEDDGVHAEQHRRERAEVEALRAFVGELGVQLSPPAPLTWTSAAAWAQQLLHRALGDAAGWPADERDAREEVERCVAALTDLDDLGAVPALELVDVVAALARELDVPFGHAGRVGQGLFIGPLDDAVGADFDVVFVVGMVEGGFPPRATHDAVLPDDDRAVVGLERHEERRLLERQTFLGALAAAPERIVSWSRADPRAQRPTAPARWLLDLVGARVGRPVGVGDLDAVATAEDWYERVPSFSAGVTGRGPALSSAARDLGIVERDRRQGAVPLAHPLVARDPMLVRGLGAVASRQSQRWTEHDGLIGPLTGGPLTDGIAPDGTQPLSATSLEQYGTCPLRYFLGQVLAVRDLDRPEEIETIHPMDRGTLVHDILEAFLRTVAPRTSPEQAWLPEERAQLFAIARTHFDIVEGRGLTGRPLLWRFEQRRLRRLLTNMLDADESIRARLGVVPDTSALELAFGDDADSAVMVPLPDGRTLSFRGRIDRIDRSPDGAHVVVFDYKTGNDKRYTQLAKEPVRRGTLLQLPVYGLAAAARAPGASVSTYYWFVENPTRTALRGYPLTEHELETFRETLDVIVSGIDAGSFPARPGNELPKTWEHCMTCQYDRLCTADRAAAWERKHDDPAVARYVELADPAPPPKQPPLSGGT